MRARQTCEEQTTDNICMPWSVLTVVINILQMVLIYGLGNVRNVKAAQSRYKF